MVAHEHRGPAGGHTATDPVKMAAVWRASGRLSRGGRAERKRRRPEAIVSSTESPSGLGEYATGNVLWSHLYNSPAYGPNGVTIADGTIYGLTATGVFALDAKTGRQRWYDTHLAAGKVSFDIPPQVAYGKVFVASALTVGGGILYALRDRSETK